MTTLARLAIVAAAFSAFPAAVALLGPLFDLEPAEIVLFAVFTLPASGVIALCTANSFGRADQTIAAAERIQARHADPDPFAMNRRIVRRHEPTDTHGETR